MAEWVQIAKRYEGLREVKGPKHSTVVLEWLDRLGAWWRDDETPWCGVYVAAVMDEAGFKPPKLYMQAKAWLNWGHRVTSPVYGCIVVFGRKGGGHVGFVVGRDEFGRLLVLGGNQDDAVNIKAFPLHRVLGYRLPPGFPYHLTRALPTVSSTAPLSENEA